MGAKKGCVPKMGWFGLGRRSARTFHPDPGCPPQSWRGQRVWSCLKPARALPGPPRCIVVRRKEGACSVVLRLRRSARPFPSQ